MGRNSYEKGGFPVRNPPNGQTIHLRINELNMTVPPMTWIINVLGSCRLAGRRQK